MERLPAAGDAIAPALGPGPVEWLHDVSESGEVTFRMGRQGSRFVAEWPSRARLTCSAEGSDVRLEPLRGAAAESLTKLEGFAKALVHDLRGCGFGVHASGVALGGNAVLLLGESGAGKSTAAAELCLRHGAYLLADDAAIVEEHGGAFRVVPSEKQHFLSAQSARALGLQGTMGEGAKALVPGVRTSIHECHLRLVVHLAFDEALTHTTCWRPVGADAALDLLGALMRARVAGRREELDWVTRLHQSVPFLKMARPSSRPSVVDEILGALRRVVKAGQ